MVTGHLIVMRNAYDIFVGKSKGKRPLERSRCRCEHNIKLYRKEIGWKVWTEYTWFRIRGQWRALVNTVMKFNFHKRRGIS
jgi:hypothetical protein